MSLHNGTNRTALALWDAMKADLPKWIHGAIARMGLPRRVLCGPQGDTSCPSVGATRGALLHDRDLQQAVIAEVFLAIRESAAQGRLPAEPEEARRWVCTVTVRIARRMATRQAPFTAAMCADAVDAHASLSCSDPERLTNARQALRQVNVHLASASEVDRDILKGIVEGESPKEIAERTGLHQATVRSRLFRLRAQLREAVVRDATTQEAA